MLDYDFTIQYKKGINMPADFLSRQTVDHLSAIDPFSPDLPQLQAADSDIIRLKHFSEHASWPQGTPKSVANQLAPLVSKIFSQDKTLWIHLSDSKRPRTVLFLPGLFQKRAMCEAHGVTLSGHDAELKTYIPLTDHYFWPTIKFDIAAHIKACVQCQVRKRSNLKKVPLQPLPTSDMPECIHVDLLDHSKLWNTEKSTFCA